MTGFMRLNLDFKNIFDNNISESKTVSNVSLIKSIERTANFSLKACPSHRFFALSRHRVDGDIWTDADTWVHQLFN